MAESNVVVTAVPFRVIAAPDTKPVPFAVRVNAGLPAATAAGEMDVRLKAPPPDPPLMVRVIAPEVVLSAFITRMLTAPAVAICAAVTFAVSCVDEPNVVGSETPSHRMVVPCAKLLPLAVSVNPALPAATVLGVMDDKVGARTPLNPPQPHQKTERTVSKRKTGERCRLIVGTSSLSIYWFQAFDRGGEYVYRADPIVSFWD